MMPMTELFTTAPLVRFIMTQMAVVQVRQFRWPLLAQVPTQR
jgi:hypothetical protein